MAIVTKEILSKSQYSFDEKGTRRTRGFQVSGLNPTLPPEQREYDAAVQPDIPYVGQAHPGLLAFLSCSRVEVKCTNSQQAEVTAYYETPNYDKKPPSTTAQCQMSVGSTVTNAQDNLDKDGNPMQVAYNDGSGVDGSIDIATVDKQIPMTVVKFSRREPGYPLDKSIAYVGKINSQGFLNKGSGTWLCTRLEGRSEDGGASCLVDYEFQYNPKGFGFTAFFKDSTGDIPFDVQPGNGISTFNVYSSIDFNALNLGF